MWQQWTNVLLGLWIIASPFLFDNADSLSTNLIVSGLIVAALALWGALEHQARYNDMRSREHRHA